MSIIKEISNYEKYDYLIENFESESDYDCKTLLAYSFYKKNSLETGILKAQKLALSRGAFQEVNNAIGLFGYLFHNKLNDYFEFRKKEDIKYPIHFRVTGGAFVLKAEYYKLLDLHFEHFFELFNLESNENILKSAKEEENLYILLIKHHSDNFISKPYILNYIQKNYVDIKSHYFINFLLDEYPNHSITNEMTIDFIKSKKGNKYYSFSIGIKIGKLFSKNDIIKDLLIDNIEQDKRLCLSALLIGWGNELIIDKYYDQFKRDKLIVNDRGVIYLLMFAKCTNDEVKSLLARLESNEQDIFIHQPHLINPLMWTCNKKVDN